MYFERTTPREPSLTELIDRLKSQLAKMQSRLQKNLSRESSLVDEITGHGGEVVESLQKGEAPAEKSLLAGLLACRRLGADAPSTDLELNGNLPWLAMRSVGDRLDKALVEIANGDVSESHVQRIADYLGEMIQPKPVYSFGKRIPTPDPVAGEARRFVAEARQYSINEIVAKLASGELDRHTAKMTRAWISKLGDVERRLEDAEGVRMNVAIALQRATDPESVISKRESRLEREDSAFIERYRIGGVDPGGIDSEFTKLGEDSQRFLAAGLLASDRRFVKMASRIDALSRQRAILRRIKSPA